MPPIKKPLPVYVSLGSSRLHIEDIEEIVQVLTEVTPVTIQAEVADNAYVLESAAQLAALPSGRIKSLRIHSVVSLMAEDGPHIRIRFDRWRSYASIFDATLQARGALDQVAKIVARNSQVQRVLRHPAVMASCMSVGAGGLLLTHVLMSPWRAVAIALLCLGSVAVATCAVAVWMPVIVIVPSRRNESPGFWRRNRDDLLKGTILAFIGAAIGSAITLLVKSW